MDHEVGLGFAQEEEEGGVNRPVEMGVDMAVAESREVMSCLIPQADSRALQIAGLEGDP